MSASEDEEASAWEREQMNRGTQSRRTFEQSSRKTKLVDIDEAKDHVKNNIVEMKEAIERNKKELATVSVEIAKSEKKITQLNNQITALNKLPNSD